MASHWHYLWMTLAKYTFVQRIFLNLKHDAQSLTLLSIIHMESSFIFSDLSHFKLIHMVCDMQKKLVNNITATLINQMWITNENYSVIRTWVCLVSKTFLTGVRLLMIGKSFESLSFFKGSAHTLCFPITWIFYDLGMLIIQDWEFCLFFGEPECFFHALIWYHDSLLPTR